MSGPATAGPRGAVRRFSRWRLTSVALTVSMAGLVGACDFDQHSGGRFAAGACPRPQPALGSQPHLNDQQREIRALRERAFRSDFFAQLELGRRYLGERVSDRNLEDPVEAATWYALALANPAGYEPLGGGGRPDRWLPERLRTVARYDDCRAFERDEAAHTLNRLLARMDDGDWEKVRNRVTYVLSTQGAAGFLILARLHDSAFGPFGEPLDPSAEDALAHHRHDQPPPPPAAQLFPRNDVDVYLYEELAAQTGDVSAYVLMRDIDRPSIQRSGYASVVTAKVNRWVAPYEFYPPDSPSSGVPHCDESPSRGETSDVALARIDELPFVHIVDALAFLGVIPKLDALRGGYVLHEDFLHPHDVQTFQAMLGREQTGRLTALEKVRAIQYAATDGSARAQLVLAVMYTEGVGVPADYARAYYWFDMASKQGSPEAKYAISTYFSQGLAGVADQNKAQAVVYQINAALSGFRPSADRLQAILSRAYDGPPLPDDARHDPSERDHW
jgi:hypothetical protein